MIVTRGERGLDPTPGHSLRTFAFVARGHGDRQQRRLPDSSPADRDRVCKAAGGFLLEPASVLIFICLRRRIPQFFDGIRRLEFDGLKRRPGQLQQRHRRVYGGGIHKNPSGPAGA